MIRTPTWCWGSCIRNNSATDPMREPCIIVIFKNVILLGYIIYLRHGGLIFQSRICIVICDSCCCQIHFLASLFPSAAEGQWRRVQMLNRSRGRTAVPAAFSANSSQACLTGTETWCCDITHFIQRTHSHVSELINFKETGVVQKCTGGILLKIKGERGWNAVGGVACPKN